MISGWAAVLLLPIAVPLALAASLWPGKKTVDRTPEEVASFLRNFLEGTGCDWDWDGFESVPITDPKLDALRKRAALAAPPNADLEELRRILADAEAIVERGTAL